MRATQLGALCSTLLALTPIGCTAADMTAVDASTRSHPALSKSTAVERPWKSDCDVVAVNLDATTLFISGTCRMAHMGRVTVAGYQTLQPDATGILFANTAAFTAANGDELHTTGGGIARPTATGLSLEGTATAIGGTGRFANASGNATLAGAVRFTGPTSAHGVYSLDGRLIY